jgi:endoglucanase
LRAADAPSKPPAGRRWVAAHPGDERAPPIRNAISSQPIAQIATRLGLLNAATRILAERAPGAWTYIDAGHADWTGPATMAKRLRAAGVARVRGFAVNVSNYIGTSQSRRYAERVRAALRRPAGYVIDTSRNGNGGNGKWCNPGGRKLGRRSTADPAALELWITNPGNSDGKCGIAPTTAAGVFSPELALRLIHGKRAMERS